MFELGVLQGAMSICSTPLTRRARGWAWLSALVVALVVFGVLAPRGDAAIPANGRSWELATFLPNSSSSGVVGMRPMWNDGERFLYAVIGPPPGTPSGSGFGYGSAVRGPASWTNTPLGFPYISESTEVFGLLAPLLPISASEDGQTLLWASIVPLTPGAPPEGETALYRQVGGTLELVSAVRPTSFFLRYPGFAGISSDGSRVVFESANHLLPADAGRAEGKSIYAWTDGSLQLVDVDGGGALLSPCGATVSKSNGMSALGNRVFFSVPASCNGVEKVYLRDLENGTTVAISASLCTRVDCNADADVSFAGATRNGDVAYMTTTQQLTNDDEDSARDLYSYDVDSGELILLSGGSALATGAVNAEVAFPAEVGGRVYFGGEGELLPGESGAGQKLFLANGTGEVRFVAEASIPEIEKERQIQLTSDGGRALFITSAQVLPGDADSQADAYLYDADKDEMTRISAGSSGGNGSFPVSITAPSPLNQHEFEAGDRRPYYSIDASGERTFFTTEESLIPEDTNGKLDVYESWHGTLGLISPGYLPLRADFAGISRDGRSAMFATNADLVAADQDGGARDLYAARLGGGFPPEAGKAGCDSGSCPLPNSERLQRGVPPSMVPLAGKRGRLRLLDVASEARKGAIAVAVSVPAPGLVTGTMWIHQKGRKIVLARGSERATRPGQAQLELKLTRAAGALAGGIKKVHLTVNGGNASVSDVVKVKLP